jgi:hypothetical protein
MAFQPNTTLEYEAGPEPPGALVISPDLVDQLGGTEVTITGTFDPSRAYAVTLGGRPCYSGVAGHGYLCRPVNSTTLRAVTPPVPSGEVGAQTVVVSHPLEDDQEGPLTVVESPFGKAHGVRRCCPPWTALGARTLDLEARRRMV